MNTHDAPAQILGRADQAEIYAALPGFLAGYQIPKGIQDEPAHLALMRLVHQAGDASRPAIAGAALQLLQSATRDVASFDKELFESLIHFCAALKDRAIVDELAAFASTFSSGHALPRQARRLVLGALVDAEPPQNEDFWVAVSRADPNGHAGMAASGLLSLNAFEKAASLYPYVIKSAMTGSIVTMLLDMKWDKLPEDGRRRLKDAIDGVIDKCKPEYAETLRSWLTSREGRVSA